MQSDIKILFTRLKMQQERILYCLIILLSNLIKTDFFTYRGEWVEFNDPPDTL